MDELNKNTDNTNQPKQDNSVSPANDGKAAELFGVSLEGTKPKEGTYNVGWKPEHEMQKIDDSAWKVPKPEKKPKKGELDLSTKKDSEAYVNNLIKEGKLEDLEGDEQKTAIAYFIRKGYSLEKIKEVAEKLNPGKWVRGVDTLYSTVTDSHNNEISLIDAYNARKSLDKERVGVAEDAGNPEEVGYITNLDEESPRALAGAIREHLDDWKQLSQEDKAEFKRTLWHIKNYLVLKKRVPFNKTNILNVLDYVNKKNRWPG